MLGLEVQEQGGHCVRDLTRLETQRRPVEIPGVLGLRVSGSLSIKATTILPITTYPKRNQ